MPLDYRPKRQISKNRPRKRPVKLILLLILGSIFSVYGLGVATGWLIFKYFPQDTPAPSASITNPEGANQQLPPSPAPATAKGVAAVEENDPDLTFYYTLPKGKTGVMGSGINNPLPQIAPKTAVTAASAPKDQPVQQKPQVIEKNEAAAPVARSEKNKITAGPISAESAKKSTGKTTYTVQVAAYHVKSDAQAMKAKLQKIGIASRIEEYTVAGKDIWYRVRSGNKLERDSANRLAAKIGQNSIIVPE